MQQEAQYPHRVQLPSRQCSGVSSIVPDEHMPEVLQATAVHLVSSFSVSSVFGHGVPLSLQRSLLLVLFLHVLKQPCAGWCKLLKPGGACCA